MLPQKMRQNVIQKKTDLKFDVNVEMLIWSLDTLFLLLHRVLKNILLFLIEYNFLPSYEKQKFLEI